MPPSLFAAAYIRTGAVRRALNALGGLVRSSSLMRCSTPGHWGHVWVLQVGRRFLVLAAFRGNNIHVVCHNVGTHQLTSKTLTALALCGPTPEQCIATKKVNVEATFLEKFLLLPLMLHKMIQQLFSNCRCCLFAQGNFDMSYLNRTPLVIYSDRENDSKYKCLHCLLHCSCRHDIVLHTVPRSGPTPLS